MVKVGKYTAALLLVTVGAFLLIDLMLKTTLIETAIQWWPLILISVGIEYLVLGALMRDPEKKVRLATGSLALSIILSIVVVGLSTGSNFSLIKNINLNFAGISLADESGIKFDKGTVVIPVKPNAQKISIENTNGDVKLVQGDSSELEVELVLYVHLSKKDEAERIAEESTIVTKQVGDTLHIIAEGKKYQVFGISQKPRMNLVITVPRDADARDYYLELTNGDILVDGVKVDKTLHAESTNGSIEAKRINGNVSVESTNGKIIMSDIHGNAYADTTNGSIMLTDIDGDAHADSTNGKVVITRVTGDVDVETTNGSVDMTDVEKDAKAETTNGSITARTYKLGGNWDLDTTHSKIQVYLPEDASFAVDGESSVAGSISTDFPLDMTKDKIKGSVNGGTFKISIETIGGIGVHKN
jgi:DUF4097 and DUF4098 domain-containing protein YvlB